MPAKKMHLYAAGFNAWNQLSFEAGPHLGQEYHDEPRDIPVFTRVLTDEAIHRVRPFDSYTFGKSRLISWSDILT